MKKIRIFFIFIFVLFILGCQLPLANYVRDNVFPKNTTTRIALSPILLPTYGVLSITDIAIVNPIRGTANVPSVVKSIWEWEDKNIWLGKGVLLPLKFVAIPVATIGTIMFSEQFIYQRESTESEGIK